MRAGLLYDPLQQGVPRGIKETLVHARMARSSSKVLFIGLLAHGHHERPAATSTLRSLSYSIDMRVEEMNESLCDLTELSPHKRTFESLSGFFKYLGHSIG